MADFEFEGLNREFQAQRGRVQAPCLSDAEEGLRTLGLWMPRVWPAAETDSLFSGEPQYIYYPSWLRALPQKDTKQVHYSTRRPLYVTGGLVMVLLAGLLVVECLRVFPLAAIGAIPFLAFPVVVTLWERKVSLTEPSGQLSVVCRIGPFVLSRTDLASEGVKGVLLKTERYFMPSFGSSVSVGAQWRWQVGVFVLRKDGPTYQVDHSSDVVFEHRLAERVSEALQAPLAKAIDPSAAEIMGRCRRGQRWGWLVWLVAMMAIIGLGWYATHAFGP